MVAWSKSKVKSFDASQHYQFETCQGSFEDLAAAVCDAPWSPCVWRGGRRAAKNFVSSEVVGLDFDGGRSIKEVMRQCLDLGLAFVIATTKSHRKEKISSSGVVSPARDRFRLVVPASRIVSKAEDYGWMMESAMNTFHGSDRACKDAGRFFFQSAKIWAWCGGGGGFVWPDRPPEVDLPPRPVIPHGQISERVRMRLMFGVDPGSRHRSLVKDCFHLGAQGVPEIEAREMVANSGYTLEMKEKMSIFNSQWRRGWELREREWSSTLSMNEGLPNFETEWRETKPPSGST